MATVVSWTLASCWTRWVLQLTYEMSVKAEVCTVQHLRCRAECSLRCNGLICFFTDVCFSFLALSLVLCSYAFVKSRLLLIHVLLLFTPYCLTTSFNFCNYWLNNSKMRMCWCRQANFWHALYQFAGRACGHS